MNCSCLNTSYCKYLGYGVAIWVVAFVLASVIVAFGITSDIVKDVVTTLAVLLVAFLLAKNLKIGNIKEMLKYSFCWAVIVFILNVIVIANFTDWALLYTWNMILAYLLIVAVPLLAVKKAA